ncbi:uncharacterized protein LOC117920762 [Vitis riparia]|uniref:uncharacterized protein LOC117920762 n=1 Tax=Vitis riparia TaxID=96939 RepID=UPI00155B1B7F|nr:uncharacterized protein LOC117920762 [Vitis riparia]
MESVQMPMNKTMALGQRLAGMEKEKGKRKRKRLSQLLQPSLMGKWSQVLIGNFPLGRVLHLGNSGKDPMVSDWKIGLATTEKFMDPRWSSLAQWAWHLAERYPSHMALSVSGGDQDRLTCFESPSDSLLFLQERRVLES